MIIFKNVFKLKPGLKEVQENFRIMNEATRHFKNQQFIE